MISSMSSIRKRSTTIIAFSAREEDHVGMIPSNFWTKIATILAGIAKSIWRPKGHFWGYLDHYYLCNSRHGQPCTWVTMCDPGATAHRPCSACSAACSSASRQLPTTDQQLAQLTRTLEQALFTFGPAKNFMLDAVSNTVHIWKWRLLYTKCHNFKSHIPKKINAKWFQKCDGNLPYIIYFSGTNRYCSQLNFS